MAFNCLVVDFGNKEAGKNLKIIRERFSHAIVVPFVKSYLDIAQSTLPASNTEYTWLLSTKVNYSKFDFDYITAPNPTASCLEQQRPNRGRHFFVSKMFLRTRHKIFEGFQGCELSSI